MQSMKSVRRDLSKKITVTSDLLGELDKLIAAGPSRKAKDKLEWIVMHVRQLRRAFDDFEHLDRRLQVASRTNEDQNEQEER